MKGLLISFACLLIVPALAVKSADNTCVVKVSDSCNKNKIDLCHSKFGGIDSLERDVQNYIEHTLTKSYDYLLMSTHFNAYEKNREGFAKVYRELSDKAFDDGIALIKHLALRGGNIGEPIKSNSKYRKAKTLDVDELQSLAIALDSEKELTEAAATIYQTATHQKTSDANNKKYTRHDPEFAHFIEEKLLKSQAETIRKLSGYANDLSRLSNIEHGDASLGVHLFDQYLAKA